MRTTRPRKVTSEGWRDNKTPAPQRHAKSLGAWQYRTRNRHGPEGRRGRRCCERLALAVSPTVYCPVVLPIRAAHLAVTMESVRANSLLAAEEAVEDRKAEDESDPQANEGEGAHRHALAVVEQRQSLDTPILAREELPGRRL